MAAKCEILVRLQAVYRFLFFLFLKIIPFFSTAENLQLCCNNHPVVVVCVICIIVDRC